MIRNAIATISIALLPLGFAVTAQAQNHATVTFQSGQSQYQRNAPLRMQYGAPPPARYESAPRPRRGKAWVPGHWEWRGNRHVWAQGYWIRARPGYHYREPRWAERDGRWDMRPGGWDRDGDGVPNRKDRRPDNPYRQ